MHKIEAKKHSRIFSRVHLQAKCAQIKYARQENVTGEKRFFHFHFTSIIENGTKWAFYIKAEQYCLFKILQSKAISGNIILLFPKNDANSIDFKIKLCSKARSYIILTAYGSFIKNRESFTFPDCMQTARFCYKKIILSILPSILILLNMRLSDAQIIIPG